MQRRLIATITVLIVSMMLKPYVSWADLPYIQVPGSFRVDTGDTAWMLFSTALVMLMVPGLAFFYGGLVRRKNVLGTIIEGFAVLCVISVVWVLWGYSLSFGGDISGFIGGGDFLALLDVGQTPMQRAPSLPHYVPMAFQGMVAVVTVVLITGALVERMRFSALLLFAVCWHTLVYCTVVHWVWGGGWLGGTLGALDFAGGIVVNISAGAAAVAALMVIGRRQGYGVSGMTPHNLPMAITGAALLWFGWFGFNAGSALRAGATASVALMTTNTAASVGALTWMTLEWLHAGKPTALGIISGAVTGLVAITPAAGYVTLGPAMIIGTVAGVLCYVAVNLKHRLHYDDSLDIIGIHVVGGMWGVLATGLFASTAVNAEVIDGLFYGNPPLLAIQSIAAVTVFVFVLVSTLLLLKAINCIIKLRVEAEEEITGLDQSQHGESAYRL
ncbi:MAG: ammonium transporter [Nitrospirae bacterium]|uniref:ammonium transporter n=1 Tax=Candidatus Magnetobacterium casense TaxID=1455061 RepID=UPI0009E072C1|nr:ammonium transporter [Candidatus Magnetobacterium casensis]MBF0336816.1 ammonium transporter [Nitrospirota bacterium]